MTKSIWRLETDLEHIARDMRDGVFPSRSDPQRVLRSIAEEIVESACRSFAKYTGQEPFAEMSSERQIRWMVAMRKAVDSALRALTVGTEAKATTETCPSCGGNGINPEGLMHPDGNLADCEVCHGRGVVAASLTSSGRYVNRRDAAEIAIAAGQVDKLIAAPDLYSEDLW